MSALKRAWERRRKAVLARDGRRCTACGRASRQLEIHHTVPGQSLRRDMKRRILRFGGRTYLSVS